MSGTVDNLIAARVLYMLVTPFDQTDAYRYGIIDKQGNVLRKSSTLNSEELDAYTYLHRLVFRLKRIIEKVPGFNTKFLSYAAAWALIREAYEKQEEPVDLEYRFLAMESVNSEDVALVEEFMTNRPLMSFRLFNEDGMAAAALGGAPANNVAVTPGIAVPPGSRLFVKKKGKQNETEILKRKETKNGTV